MFLQHNIGNCSVRTLYAVLVFPREVFNLSGFSSLYLCPCAQRFVLMLVTRVSCVENDYAFKGMRRNIHGRRWSSVAGISSDAECQSQETAEVDRNVEDT